MAQAVVHLLEVVEVHHQQRHRRAVALGTRQFIGGQIGEAAAVERTGQRIGVGQAFQPGLGFLAAGDVHAQAGHTQRLAVGRAFHHPAAGLHPHPVALPVANAELGLEGAGAAQQVGLPGQDAGRCIVGVHQRVPRGQGVGHLVGPVAQHRVPVAVDRAHAAGAQVGVPEHQVGVHHRQVHQRGQLLLALLVAQFVGHVGQHRQVHARQHAGHGGVLRVDHAAVDPAQAHPAAGMATRLELGPGRCGVDAVGHHHLGHGQAHQLVVAVAQQPAGSGVGIQVVPVVRRQQDGIERMLEDGRQPRLGARQGLLGPQALGDVAPADHHRRAAVGQTQRRDMALEHPAIAQRQRIEDLGVVGRRHPGQRVQVGLRVLHLLGGEAPHLQRIPARQHVGRKPPQLQKAGVVGQDAAVGRHHHQPVGGRFEGGTHHRIVGQRVHAVGWRGGGVSHV